MAIQTTLNDRHLYSATSNGFTNTTNPFSICVWINANWGVGATNSMVGVYDGTPGTGAATTNAGVQIGTRAGTGICDCWVYGGAVLISTPAATMTPFTNVWCLVSYTWDGTSHRLYINNVLSATSTTAFVPVTLTQIYINGFPPTGSTAECEPIGVDSYSYFSRTLSIGEISSIYNAAGARHGITYGLVARYEFDEGADTTVVSSVIDMSNGGNNLSVIGAAAATTMTYTYTNVYANSNLRPVQ